MTTVWNQKVIDPILVMGEVGLYDYSNIRKSQILMIKVGSMNGLQCDGGFKCSFKNIF